MPVRIRTCNPRLSTLIVSRPANPGRPHDGTRVKTSTGIYFSTEAKRFAFNWAAERERKLLALPNIIGGFAGESSRYAACKLLCRMWRAPRAKGLARATAGEAMRRL